MNVGRRASGATSRVVFARRAIVALPPHNLEHAVGLGIAEAACDVADVGVAEAMRAEKASAHVDVYANPQSSTQQACAGL